MFLGCLPFYGFHLLMCWAVGTVLRLNRLKVYLAANISNPFVAPWLIFVELQAGAFFRHGSFQAIPPQAIRTAGIGSVGLDLLVGSVLVGTLLAALAGGATYATVRVPAGDAAFMDLVRRASDRYVGTSITAWEFARGKLRGDPLYRATVFGRLLPSGGTLIDVGCGQGLTLAILAEARRAVDEGPWPSSSPVPPRFDRMIGIELRPRVAELARRALQGDADIMQGDARSVSPGEARAVLLFDVLHLMDPADQDAMLAGLAKTLERDGVLLVRDADGVGRVAVPRGSARQPSESVRCRGLAATVLLPHAPRVARLLCPSWFRCGSKADGRGHAIRKPVVPPYRETGRVWVQPPTCTSCLTDTSVHVKRSAEPEPAVDVPRPGRVLRAVAQVGPEHRATPAVLGAFHGESEFVHAQEVADCVERPRHGNQGRLRLNGPREERPRLPVQASTCQARNT